MAGRDSEALRKVSIHAPREGSDAAMGQPMTRKGVFQSTLPVKGATCQYIQTEKYI